MSPFSSPATPWLILFAESSTARTAELSAKLSKKHPAFKVIYALSDKLGGNERWDGETGFIHLSVDKYLEKDKPRQAFLCGPPLMIDAVTKVLLGKGLSNEQIFFDDFGS